MIQAFMLYFRYVDKNIAMIVSEKPFTVRLLFEPSGRAVGEVGEYYKTPKDNKCVCCGRLDSYNRKNIVPREYRKYFPGKYFVSFKNVEKTINN